MEEGTIEVDVTPTRTDAWEWRAIYADGSFLDEYDEHGQHGWKDIDLENLTVFALLPQQPGLPAHALHLTQGARPIFFRRRTIELSLDSSEQQGRKTVHVLGHQSTVRGINVISYTALFDDGSVLVTDDPTGF